MTKAHNNVHSSELVPAPQRRRRCAGQHSQQWVASKEAHRRSSAPGTAPRRRTRRGCPRCCASNGTAPPRAPAGPGPSQTGGRSRSGRWRLWSRRSAGCRSGGRRGRRCGRRATRRRWCARTSTAPLATSTGRGNCTPRGRECVTTETRPLDRLGRSWKPHAAVSVGYSRGAASRPAWPARRIRAGQHHKLTAGSITDSHSAQTKAHARNKVSVCYNEAPALSPARLARGLMGAYNERPRGDSKLPPYSVTASYRHTR